MRLFRKGWLSFEDLFQTASADYQVSLIIVKFQIPTNLSISSSFINFILNSGVSAGSIVKS